LAMNIDICAAVKLRTRGQVESSLARLERSGERQQQLNLAVGRQRYKEI
jgi:hypothetical protein